LHDWGALMRKFMHGTAALTLSLLSVSAEAQEAKDTQPPAPTETTMCFTVVSAVSKDVEPASLVLLNKCSGATWLLTRVAVPKQKGSNRDIFTYEWAPLPIGQEAPMLTYPTMKELQQQFK
jgi:hypothetical protein